MGEPRTARRPVSRAKGVPGIKILISSLALVATLAGWGLLAAQPPTPAPVVKEIAAAPRVVEVRTVSYRLPALPTLVPLVDPPRASARRARPAAPAAAPASGMPQLATLREVSAPPPPPPQPEAQPQDEEPAAVSRSSR
jgi:hypothetical protein